VSLVNTAFYAIASTLPILAIPLALAIALNRGVALRTFLRGAFFFPFTLSVVTVGLTWLWLLDPVVGPLNYYLKALGVPARSWLADPTTAMWAIIVTSVWWVTGYYLVVYLAGLQDIPRELYEAAALDGANWWSAFWKITFPLLRPAHFFVAVVSVIGALQMFDAAFIAGGKDGSPANSLTTMVLFLYQAWSSFQFGFAASVGIVLLILLMTLTLIQRRLFGETPNW
jgi:multiple sugar transport system permease protein